MLGGTKRRISNVRGPMSGLRVIHDLGLRIL
jgi:hypothetical protein